IATATTTATAPATAPAPASGGGLGRFAHSAQVWEAAVRLLTAIISHVGVDGRLFDEVLELLADRLAQDVGVRDALEVVNADAVWLAMYERGEAEWVAAPVV